MNTILVVSDNEFLNLLYVMNLEVYLNSKIVLVKSVNSAIDSLKAEKIDLIISLDIIKKEESGTAIIKYLNSCGKKIPLIVSSNLKAGETLDMVFFVAGKYNIQEILKVSAKNLGITSKKMSELNIGSFYPISIKSLISLTKAPCHIYLNATSQKYLIRQDDPMDNMAIKLAKDGVEQVFVASSDRLLVINKISLNLIEKITVSLKNLEAAPVAAKVQVLSEGYDFAASNLFSSDEIKQQMQEIATAAATVMGDVGKETSNLKALMAIMLSNKDGYIFTHSMLTSYVAYHMIKNVTWGGEGQVEKINFVLFFHDIFLAPIYLKHPTLKHEKDLMDSEILTEKEKDVVLHHAKLAAEMVVGYKRCPMGVDILIKQHHGSKKGRGFIQNYPEDLSPLSKILIIAEIFVEEFLSCADNSIPFDMKITIPKMVSEFTNSSYLKIIKTLVNVPL